MKKMNSKEIKEAIENVKASLAVENIEFDKLSISIGEKYLGRGELIRAIEDPLVELAVYAKKEYEKGNTQNLRNFVKEEGIELNE